MSAPADPDEHRGEMRARWERAAAAWERYADEIRGYGMPVSSWMIEHAQLQPGEVVLELAAGPGDTGFLASELIAPGGRLISSDGAEAMVAAARERAERLGVQGAEFRTLELEWIDLPTASVDVVLCRWGVMLLVDPAAALQEIRRVLRPGGRACLAVWASADENPWARLPTRVLLDRGLTELPPPGAPGMFALADSDRLAEMLEQAGFVEPVIEEIRFERRYESVQAYLDEQLGLTLSFSDALAPLPAEQREEILRELADALTPYRDGTGAVVLPACSLGAAAGA